MKDGSEPSPPNQAPVLPRAAVAAMMKVRAALIKAANALVPAQVVVAELALGAAATAILGEIARRGIPEALEARPMTAGELAEWGRCHPDSLRRTMRAGVAAGLFVADSDGRYRNTRLGAALARREDSAGDLAVYFSSASNLKAWSTFGRALDSGGSPFELEHGRTVWDWFEAHQDQGRTFARAMASITRLEAPAIAKAYPFSELRSVCDVGGGSGTLLGHLLVAWPALRGGLLEAPHVLRQAQARFESWGILDRAELRPGSFFDEVPSGFDAYVLKNTLHDWDDERCLRILGNVRRAAQPGGRLLVCEGLTDDPLPPAVAFSDLQMMVVCSGRERSRREFESLLSRSGFRLSRVVPTSSPLTWVIEGIAV